LEAALLLLQKFCNKIAQNEKEALDYIVKDKLDIIDIENIRIEDITKTLDKNDISEERKNNLEKLLEKSKKSLDENTNKLNLLRERLKENNCCPLCYNEFDEMEKKMLSKCCKNIICYTCTNNWFNNMKKENCIYCNQQEIKFEDYILLKASKDNVCLLCDKEYETNNIYIKLNSFYLVLYESINPSSDSYLDIRGALTGVESWPVGW
jgi:hypothetical protein